MGNKYSDLPFKVSGEKIILLQPELSIGEEKHRFLANDKLLSKVFAQTMKLEGMVHISSVHCYNYDSDPGKPIGLGPDCNGTITIKTATEVVRGCGFGEKTQIICSNPACNMKLSSRLTIPEISNTVFHLMIKQMIPDLQTCNYIDCSALRKGHWPTPTIKVVEKINALGLISLSSAIFFGLVRNGYFSDYEEEFGLGFTLMPGMNTANGCDGFDKWFRFLVIKKFELLKKQQQTLMADLLGPKPRTKS